MENDQNMNNNDPLNTAGSDNSNNTNTYVRADDTAGDADVTRLAQPVGESYEGATYVRAGLCFWGGPPWGGRRAPPPRDC